MDYSTSIMYDRLDEIRLLKSNVKSEWDFLWQFIDDTFFDENADILMRVVEMPEHVRFFIEVVTKSCLALDFPVNK